MPVKRLILAAVASGAFLSLAGNAYPPLNDRTTVQEGIAALGSTSSDAVRESVAKAKALIERAERFRAAGDLSHANAAEKAARSWVERASTQERLLLETRRLREFQELSLDAGVQVERERALLEERLIERERLLKEVERVEADLDQRFRDGGKSTPKQKNTAAPGKESKSP